MIDSPPVVHADVAFTQMINRTSQTFTTNAPKYMTYNVVMKTHIEGPVTADKTDRFNVAVRVADDTAMMTPAPAYTTSEGATATPLMPYFTPFSQFTFQYYVNLQRSNLTIKPGAPWSFTHPDVGFADKDAGGFGNATVSFAPDSTPEKSHLILSGAPNTDACYPQEAVLDAMGQPELVTVKCGRSTLRFDYSMVDGHWVATHFRFATTDRVGEKTLK